MNNFTEYNVPCTWKMSAVIIQITINILGIFLNIMLLYAHKKDPHKLLRSSSSPFIVNIAIIDLLASCVNLARLFLFNSYLNLNVSISSRLATSKLLKTVITFLESISFTSFFCLSIERFFSVAFPLWHRVQITTRVIRYWLAAVWLFHFTYEGILYVIFIYGYEVHWMLCKLSLAWTTFFLTQIVYFASYISLRKQRNGLYKRQGLNEASIRMIKIRLESEKNFLTTIEIVCSILALTLLPILTILSVSVLSAEEWSSSKVVEPAKVWGKTLMTLNFAVNGLIYLWRMKKYRKTFKKLFCKCLGT